MRRSLLPVLVVLLLGATAVRAQDVLTLGTGSAPAGGVASIPVSVIDRTGTALGTDAGAGKRIQGLAFKVMFPTATVASMTFARGGVIAPLTPLFESSPQTDGTRSYIVVFDEATNPIPFTPNAAPPGDLIGTLSVTLQPTAAGGSSIALQLDPPSAIYSNEAGTTRETVALGNLALVNGTVNVTVGTPTSVVATATSTSQVSVTWNAAPNANHYEVWRSFDGGAFTLVGSPGANSFSDSSVVAGKTYLYRVRGVDGSGGTSAFSNIDPATTILFTDDPLVAGATIFKAVHITQLRAAVNAFRASASLAALPSDPTIGTGLVVRAAHVTDLRTALNQARSAVGLGTLSFTDSLTPGVTLIKAVHLQELRNGVK
jgi:hypothetical protein